MVRPKLTFAIPFYRGRDYLERAITSVLRQTEPSWRLIVSDDGGSEEGIVELVRSYRDERLSYHRNERNLGMVANWNRCLDLAETDLVNLLHADDELLEQYAALMTTAAQRYPQAAALFCAARVIGEDSQPRISLPDLYKRLLVFDRGDPLVLRGQDGLQALLRGDFIMCPTVCYRKSCLGPRRFSERWQMVQDLELFSRLLLEGEVLVGLAAAGYAYRRHAQNASAVYTESLLRFQEESQLYDELGRAATQRGWGGAARTARGKQVIGLHLLYRIAADLLRLRPRAAWEKTALLAQLASEIFSGRDNQTERRRER